MKPENRKIQAVAFDLDGLMFNTEDLYDEVSDKILRQRGCQFSLELKMKMMGLPGPKAIAVMKSECGLQDSAEQLMRLVEDEMLLLLPSAIQPMPGLMALLQFVEECGLPKSVATSSTRRFVTSVMEITGLGPRFEFVLSSADVTNGKPHPEIYLTTANRHKIEAMQMLVLEDSVTGSKAAVASGAITVAVPGHHSRQQDFSHVDYQLESLADPKLLELVGSNSSKNL